MPARVPASRPEGRRPLEALLLEDAARAGHHAAHLVRVRVSVRVRVRVRVRVLGLGLGATTRRTSSSEKALSGTLCPLSSGRLFQLGNCLGATPAARSRCASACTCRPVVRVRGRVRVRVRTRARARIRARARARARVRVRVRVRVTDLVGLPEHGADLLGGVEGGAHVVGCELGVVRGVQKVRQPHAREVLAELAERRQVLGVEARALPVNAHHDVHAPTPVPNAAPRPAGASHGV